MITDCIVAMSECENINNRRAEGAYREGANSIDLKTIPGNTPLLENSRKAVFDEVRRCQEEEGGRRRGKKCCVLDGTVGRSLNHFLYKYIILKYYK